MPWRPRAPVSARLRPQFWLFTLRGFPSFMHHKMDLDRKHKEDLKFFTLYRSPTETTNFMYYKEKLNYKTHSGRQREREAGEEEENRMVSHLWEREKTRRNETRDVSPFTRKFFFNGGGGKVRGNRKERGRETTDLPPRSNGQKSSLNEMRILRPFQTVVEEGDILLGPTFTEADPSDVITDTRVLNIVDTRTQPLSVFTPT